MMVVILFTLTHMHMHKSPEDIKILTIGFKCIDVILLIHKRDQCWFSVVLSTC